METMDHAEAIRKLSDLLKRMHERADTVAIGVAIAYEDGSTASMYESENNAALIGALELLRDRIIEEMRD